jgi:hypothetical protein
MNSKKYLLSILAIIMILTVVPVGVAEESSRFWGGLTSVFGEDDAVEDNSPEAKKRMSMIEKMINRTKGVKPRSMRDAMREKFFYENYDMGFSVNEVIKIAKSIRNRHPHRDMLLLFASEAYLHTYSDEDIQKLADKVWKNRVEDSIHLMLADKDDSKDGKIQDMGKSIFITEILAEHEAQLSVSTRSDDKLIRKFKSNLHRDFSASDVLRVSWSLKVLNHRDEVLLMAAKAYADRYSIADLRRLSGATWTVGVGVDIMKLAQ